jgi:hypothetical protein
MVPIMPAERGFVVEERVAVEHRRESRGIATARSSTASVSSV